MFPDLRNLHLSVHFCDPGDVMFSISDLFMFIEKFEDEKIQLFFFCSF